MAIDLTNIHQFYIDLAKSEFPDLDYREGTGFRDVVIDPFALFNQPLADEIDAIQFSQTVVNAGNMSEDDLDAILANSYVTRRTGAKSSGVVRLFFSAPQRATVETGAAFTSKGGVSFVTNQTFTVSREQMALNVQGSLYYMEVIVESVEAGTDANVDIGDIIGIDGGPSGVVSVSNPSEFTSGRERETNDELAARAKYAVGVRDLNVEPAIRIILLETFEALQDVIPIGYGDPEMIRDILIGQNMSLGGFPLGSTSLLHIGGKTDIYMKALALQQHSVDVSNVTSNIVLRAYDADIDGATPPANDTFVPDILRPVLIINSIEEINVSTGQPTGRTLDEGIDYEWVVDVSSLRYSNIERTRLVLLNTATGVVTGGGTYIGTTLRINYTYSSDVATVQTFVEARENRITNADLLAKYGVPGLIDMTVYYKSDRLVDPLLPVDATDAILQSLATLPFGDPVEVSDIQNILYGLGADYVQPFTITATVRLVDGTIQISTTNDTLQLDRNVAIIPNIIQTVRIT
jgi:hypothetical protein